MDMYLLNREARKRRRHRHYIYVYFEYGFKWKKKKKNIYTMLINRENKKKTNERA